MFFLIIYLFMLYITLKIMWGIFSAGLRILSDSSFLRFLFWMVLLSGILESFSNTGIGSTIIAVALISRGAKWLRNRRFRRKAQKEAQKEAIDVVGTPVREEELLTENEKILRQANLTTHNLRQILKGIQNPEIRDLGFTLCGEIQKILETLTQKQDQIADSRQLWNYYLPSLEKILTKFRTLEAHNMVDKDLLEKVRAYLDEVISAVKKLYLSLFSSDKVNLDIEMEAMRLAMVRDGLIDDLKEVSPEGTLLELPETTRA